MDVKKDNKKAEIFIVSFWISHLSQRWVTAEGSKFQWVQNLESFIPI